MKKWQRDDEWQKGKRNRFLPRLYKHLFLGYVFLDGLEQSPIVEMLQREYAIDTFVQTQQGTAKSFEEKLERWPGYKRVNFALETDSCTIPGHEKKGWMHYGESDYLLYGFLQESGDELEVYILKFQPLKKWFWKVYQNYKYKIVEDTDNKTGIRLVPIEHALKAPGVEPRHYIVTDNDVQKIPVMVDMKAIQLRQAMEAIQVALKAQYEEDPWLEEEDR